MSQYLKDEIQEKIVAAAIKLFAEKGFHGATMLEIGRAARVSTGNIYRYYENKETLFYAIINEEFTERFLELMRQKIESLDGARDIRSLKTGSPYHLLSEQLMAFCIENRLRIVILLSRSQGTRYEGFADEVIETLFKLAIAHVRVQWTDLCLSEVMRFNLNQIYGNSLRAIVGILNRFDEKPTLRQAIQGYLQFHLAGLKGFFK